VSNRCMYFSKVASPMTAANPSRRTKLSCTCLTAPFGGPRPFFLSQTSAAPRHQIRRELLGTPLWNWRRWAQFLRPGHLGPATASSAVNSRDGPGSWPR
jgi:hypothetical protein